MDGRETAIDPVDLSGDKVLGILVDRDTTIKDFDKRFDTNTSMPMMFSIMNIVRSIVEFGDLFLMILAAILMIACRLMAPFMIATIVDQKLANKTLYPYVYGVIALTLVWPSTQKVLMGIAYMFGNVAMAVGDKEPLYKWDVVTMRAITDPLAQPGDTVLLAIFLMGIGAIALYGVPFLSLYFLSGRVYEGISTVVSGAYGAIVGTGVAKVSAEAGASLERQAAERQYNAGYQADVTRAGAGMEAANLRAQGQRVGAMAQIQSALTGQVGSTLGAAASQKMIIAASAGFQRSTVVSDISRNIRETGIGQMQSNRQTWNMADKEVQLAATEVHSSKARMAGDAIREAIPPEVPGVRDLGVAFEYPAMYNRYHGAVSAAHLSRDRSISYTNEAATDSVKSSTQYQSEMERNINVSAAAQVAGVDTGAGQAIGSYERGAGQARAGVERSYQKELESNQESYRGQVEGANIGLGGNMEAAQLRQAAAVISTVGREISREIQNVMRQKY